MKTEWRELAACKGDTAIMYPPRGNYGALRQALDMCASCPVTSQCLDFALEFDETEGIWGGTSGRQRRDLRKTKTRQLNEAMTRGHGIIATYRAGCRCEMCSLAADRLGRRRLLGIVATVR